jgi:hypothetical protein
MLSVTIILVFSLPVPLIKTFHSLSLHDTRVWSALHVCPSICCFLDFVTRFWNSSSFSAYSPGGTCGRDVCCHKVSHACLIILMHHPVLTLNCIGICIWHDSPSALMCNFPHYWETFITLLVHVVTMQCSDSWKHTFSGLPNASWAEFAFLNLYFICCYLRMFPFVTPNLLPSHQAYSSCDYCIITKLVTC